MGALLQTWTELGDLSRAPDGAEQGLGWDVATLRQLVRTDEAVEAAWRAFCPSGKPQPNDAFSQIVKRRVDSTLGVEQVPAFKVGQNKGPLLGHLASCTSTTAKVWKNVVVRCPSPFPIFSLLPNLSPPLLPIPSRHPRSPRTPSCTQVSDALRAKLPEAAKAEVRATPSSALP